MIAAWAVYGIALTVLLALAARAAEETLDAWELPTRWVWAAAAAASVAVPALLRWDLVAEIGAGVGELLAAGGEGAAAGTGAGGLGAAEALAAAPPPAGSWPEILQFPAGADRAVLALWAVGSALVLAGALRAWWRVRRGRRDWPSRRIAGTEVLVSGETGPAVSGLLDPVIVVPRRILDLPEEERRLVVAHERQHREAGDPALLAVGLAALAVCPWNPALWWVVRRLRLAVERDCDRRVLEAGVDPRAYGSVLLAEAGARPAPLPAAALGHGRSHLEHRIRALARDVPRFRTLRSAVAVIAAAALVAVACDAPTPADPAPPAGGEAATSTEVAAEAADSSGAAAEAGESPRFVPRDRDPELANGPEVRRDLVRKSASLDLEDAGRGSASLWLYVDRSGEVARVRFRESSGHEALDRAAMEVARAMEFEPATRGGEPVGVWMTRTVTLADGHDAAASTIVLRPKGGSSTALDSLRPEDVESVSVAPGVTPGTGTADVEAKDGRTIRIRGNAAIRNGGGPDLDVSSVPVVFVDGERVRTGPGTEGRSLLDDLDPDEIESIEVVKGPAAAALYGEEARNGVVLIRTKGGGS